MTSIKLCGIILARGDIYQKASALARQKPIDGGKMKINHELLKALRKEKFTTLSEAASTAGVNASHLSDLEYGKKLPGLEVLGRLARAYGYELELRFVQSNRDDTRIAIRRIYHGN